MNTSTIRASSLLFSLLLALLLAFPVFCEGGDGSGGGENHDNPLTLVQENCNINTKGKTEFDDPNIQIVLYFTKNVVNIKVRDNNKKCFSVTDNKGNTVPITVEMGDDQTDPSDTTKRTVTIVPDAPYKTGKSYTLKISKGLAAKNGRDVLEEDIILQFAIRAQSASDPASSETVTSSAAASSGTTAAYVRRTAGSYIPASPDAGTTTTTTTTTKPAETSAKTPRTTKPVIVAATRGSTTQTATAAQKTEPTTKRVQTTAPSTKQTVSATVSQSPNRGETITWTTVEEMTQTIEPTTETTVPVESDTVEETVGETEPYSVFHETETGETEPETSQVSEETQTHRSRALLTGFIIAIAAAAAAIISIIRIKKKKG